MRDAGGQFKTLTAQQMVRNYLSLERNPKSDIELQTHKALRGIVRVACGHGAPTKSELADVVQMQILPGLGVLYIYIYTHAHIMPCISPGMRYLWVMQDCWYQP